MNDWVEGYRKALREFVILHGKLVLRTSYYGTSYDYHLTECEVDRGVSKFKVREEVLHEFADTYSPSLETQAVILEGVYCACGEVRNGMMRWDGTVGEIMNKILLEGDE